MDEKVNKPIIAITMGDPAGIGPEICVGAMQDPVVHDVSHPLIIGSRIMLEKAAQIMKAPLKFNVIEELEAARFEPGIVDLIETGDYHEESLVWGQVQQLAGEMAYDFIRRSIELGLDGKIDGVATCPINKQAIKLAGIQQAGHTEIYQDLTHSAYALTMFSCHKLRVFFLSRHMSLMDACRYVNREHTLDSIKLVDEELRKTGIKNPLIVVAALNPHASDNGLFGLEEERELIPAIEEARGMGINAIGPVPADSVFHIGKSGAYDAILSLYHDQGHIACKTLDFDKTVTLIFGLPFIRGSVDHGTAFDIAGQGKASAVSLIEAVRVVAEYSRKVEPR